MQGLEHNNINGLAEIGDTLHGFRLWQENKYLVLQANGPVEKIELVPYCIRCGQPVTELTKQSAVNYMEAIPTNLLVMLIVGVIILLVGMVGAYAMTKSHTVLLICVIVFISFVLGVIFFCYKSINKSSAINLYYGLCQPHIKKQKNITRLKRLTEILFMVMLLIAAINPPWISAILLVMLIDIIWLKLDHSLSLYKTQKSADTTTDYYLSGCQPAFFNQLTLAIKDK